MYTHFCWSDIHIYTCNYMYVYRSLVSSVAGVTIHVHVFVY